MTDKTKQRMKGSLFALSMMVALGYGLFAWSFPSSSMAQPSVISGNLDGVKLHNQELLASFYQEREYRPVWIRGASTFQPRATAAIKILQNSWTHGLNPENYHVSRLIEQAAMGAGMNRNEFDMLLSDGLMRYVRDMTGMRGSHSPRDRSDKYWRQPMDEGQILEKVFTAADPVREIQKLEPSSKLYQAMRAELIRLATASDEETSVTIKAGLKPGRADSGIPALRAKMGFAAKAEQGDMYDDELAAAVIKVQQGNGQKADGVLRAETLSVLNRSAKDKMMQIIANMERMRWMEEGRPDRYILVNIPSASLWAVEDGKVALEMPVIVGKTARQTNSFKTEITGVRFNPNWTVPPTIKRKDFLPMLQQDPEALAKRGIRMTQNGKTIDPKSIDWGNMGSKGLSQIGMVQPPSDKNPLGKVRVIMENPYNIYLHDTNSRELFEKDERTLSSGCVRVKYPEQLAAFILKKNKEWTEEGMRKLIDSGRMRDIPTDEKIPVYITYQTIWLDSEGKLIYGQDVYKQDARLADMLKTASGIHIPQISENTEISL